MQVFEIQSLFQLCTLVSKHFRKLKLARKIGFFITTLCQNVEIHPDEGIFGNSMKYYLLKNKMLRWTNRFILSYIDGRYF